MTAWNLSAFNFIHQWSGRFVALDVVAIFFAQYLPYLMVAGFLVFVFYQLGTRRKFYLFAEGSLAVILARGIITESIKFFYGTARPFDALGFSPLIGESGSAFPSGHMAWFFALVIIIWFASRTWGAWYLGLTVLMGVARVYAGVHWPLDIIGGIAVGVASGYFVHWLFRGSRKALAAPEKGMDGTAPVL